MLYISAVGKGMESLALAMPLARVAKLVLVSVALPAAKVLSVPCNH